MKNKFVRINDFYFEILELCDYYNIVNKYQLIIDAIFELAISCALNRSDWKYSDYIRLYDVLIVKDELIKLMKAFFIGGIKNDTYN